MITKFKIFESKKSFYRISNKFSEEHRIYLPDNCLLSDIDLIYTQENEIKTIVEDKYIFKNQLNDILNPNYWQRKGLLNFTNTLNCSLILNEQSTDKWIYVKKDNSQVNVDTNYINNKLNTFKKHNTEEKLYIEIRYNKVISVMYINELDPILIDILSKKFRLFKININDNITISELNGQTLNINSPEDWKKVYSEFKLL